MIGDKRLGQHFLTDRNILQRIVDALEPAPDDVVVEIGAGTGSLTDELLARGLRVIAIEKDRRLAGELGTWNAERGTERLTVVHGDALRLDWHALVDTGAAVPRSGFRVPRFKIVGNIPYAITSPLIDKALTPPLPTCIVFLVQAEVADRIARKRGIPRIRHGLLHPASQAAAQRGNGGHGTLRRRRGRRTRGARRRPDGSSRDARPRGVRAALALERAIVK